MHSLQYTYEGILPNNYNRDIFNRNKLGLGRQVLYKILLKKDLILH